MAQTELQDFAPSIRAFRHAVVAGLGRRPKTLPCKFFYDETGALLFEAICTLDVYYPTRTEVGIMADCAAEMAEALGPRVRLVEPGSGSLQKVRYLLEHLEDPVAFVPIDIAREQLEQQARVLAREFPRLLVQPVCADFTERFELPEAPPDVGSTAVYYPGSTIGNFERDEAVAFLRRMRRIAGADGSVLVGVDLDKDAHVLELAYDDPIGVTAAFNKNLLERINRELGADFDLDAFRHRAVYDAKRRRVVIELVSVREQTVHVGDEHFCFGAGESIVTEYSHKPSLDDFRELARTAGLDVERVWTDAQEWFSVQLLRPVRRAGGS